MGKNRDGGERVILKTPGGEKVSMRLKSKAHKARVMLLVDYVSIHLQTNPELTFGDIGKMLSSDYAMVAEKLATMAEKVDDENTQIKI